MWHRVFLCVLALACISGCAPRTVVRKNPCDNDRGIRFYRPKPYLLVTPGSEITSVEDQAKKTITTKKGVGNSDQFVTIKLEYLPDFAEEYAIEVKPGLGTNNTVVNLEDGWNLTTVDQKLDAKFDENLGAVTELAKVVVGGVGNKATMSIVGGGSGPDLPELVVSATDVPIGYYESVIGMHNGKKRLYGWRYVGFAPYLQCPAEGRGASCLDCNTEGEVFGLVFRNGIMTFAPLSESRHCEPALVHKGDTVVQGS